MKAGKQEKQWDPNDPGLNKEGEPGNYSTGREDQRGADPEQRPGTGKPPAKEKEKKDNPVKEETITNPGPGKGGG